VILGVIAYLIEAYVIVLVVRAVLSWFPARPGTTLFRVVQLLDAITEPVLRPIRRVLPPVGVGGMAIDLSILIVIVVAQVIVVPLLRS
jgi:YggT family protein